MKRVLIITMYCGEPQFQRCVNSVKNQVGVVFEQIVIKDKPNLQAHKELYKKINEYSEHYDFFVKLDADMEFSCNDALSRIIMMLDEQTDYLTIPVFDYFTRNDMPMFHVYSNRVRFDTESMDALYVDNVRMNYPGRKISVIKSFSLILHCFQPSNEQAFTFGVHRAMKVTQTDRKVPNLGASWYHFNILISLYSNFVSNREQTLLYAINGAIEVFDGNYNSIMDNKKEFMNSKVNLEFLTDKRVKIFTRNRYISILLLIGFNRFLKSTLSAILKRFF